MTAAILGILAGLVHVVAGPDHLAAVSPLTVDRRRKAWWLGIHWGLGHTVGVAVIGILALMFRQTMAVEQIAAGAEWLVGVSLVAIGLWGFHMATVATTTQKNHIPNRRVSVILGVGVLHGLGGGSHLLSVLPGLAFPHPSQVITYILAYGIGTILAMTCFSMALSQLAAWVRTCGHPEADRQLLAGASLVTLVVGGFWLIQ